jgi:hypothetical protein
MNPGGGKLEDIGGLLLHSNKAGSAANVARKESANLFVIQIRVVALTGIFSGEIEILIGLFRQFLMLFVDFHHFISINWH